MESTAYLSLGSNVGDREANIRAAISRLKELGHIEAVSSMYETEPVEVTDQPWFINGAVKLLTAKSPDDLLAGVLGIERSMGRERTRPKGPRNIDIDILLYGDRIVTQAGLTIPHPGLPERMFVLAPLAELAPELRHPVLGNTMLQLRDALPKGHPVVRLVETAKRQR
jgi:2-amino-4-hydroxy-6-hydroxymethyldihydropteridine diphosphokinase